MAPCYFFLFPELKKMMAGIAYDDEEDLFSAVQGCLKQLSRMASTTPLKTGFRDVINALLKREDIWKKIPKPCLSMLLYI